MNTTPALAASGAPAALPVGEGAALPLLECVPLPLLEPPLEDEIEGAGRVPVGVSTPVTLPLKGPGADVA